MIEFDGLAPWNKHAFTTLPEICRCMTPQYPGCNVQAPKDRNWWKSWHLLNFIKFNKGFRKVTRPNFMVLLTPTICKQYFKQRILRLHQLYVPSTGRSNVWFCVSHQDTSVKTATWTHTRLIRNTRPRVQCSWPLGHDTPSLLILSLLPAPISVRLAK